MIYTKGDVTYQITDYSYISPGFGDFKIPIVIEN